MTRLPLPEPHGQLLIWDHNAKPNDPVRYRDIFTADQMRDYADACNAALQTQLDAARSIIMAQDERSTQQAREIGPLMQRAADVEGEREANAILTAENAALREQVRVLTEALGKEYQRGYKDGWGAT